MSMFSNDQKEVMNNFMRAFINLADVCPGIEPEDLKALLQIEKFIKDDEDLPPEVADAYRMVFDRVCEQIFGRTTRPSVPAYGNLRAYRYPNYYNITKYTDLNKRLIFDTYDEAESFVDNISDDVNNYGPITIDKIIGKYNSIYKGSLRCQYTDVKYGYYRIMDKDVSIVRYNEKWTILFDRPTRIENVGSMCYRSDYAHDCRYRTIDNCYRFKCHLDAVRFYDEIFSRIHDGSEINVWEIVDIYNDINQDFYQLGYEYHDADRGYSVLPDTPEIIRYGGHWMVKLPEPVNL